MLLNWLMFRVLYSFLYLASLLELLMFLIVSILVESCCVFDGFKLLARSLFGELAPVDVCYDFCLCCFCMALCLNSVTLSLHSFFK